jgi:hypothetical protein
MAQRRVQNRAKLAAVIPSSNPMSSPFRQLWAWPVALGALTASGLASALVSDHWGDVWSWVALGVPVAVMAYFAWRRG